MNVFELSSYLSPEVVVLSRKLSLELEVTYSFVPELLPSKSTMPKYAFEIPLSDLISNSTSERTLLGCDPSVPSSIQSFPPSL